MRVALFTAILSAILSPAIAFSAGFESTPLASQSQSTPVGSATKSSLTTVAAVAALRMKAQEETQKQVIRQSESYKRLFKMCSTSGDLSRLIYVYGSVSQTVNLGLLNGSEVTRMLHDKSGLSAMLAYDLSQDGLFLATADCGMTQDQRDYFVMSLITLDLSGKLLGAAGVVGIYKATTAIMSFIRSKSVLAQRLISASGIAYGAFQFYRQLSPESVKVYKQEHPEVLTEDSILDHFNIEKIKEETSQLKISVLASLDREIFEIDQKLANLELSSQHNSELARTSRAEAVSQLLARRANLESKKQVLSAS